MADELSFRSIRETARRVRDALPTGTSVEREDNSSTIEVHFGEVTSTTTTAGKYPGKRYNLTNPTTNPVTWAEAEVCWIRRPNVGEILAIGSTPIKWPMKLVGTHTDGKAVFEALDFIRFAKGTLAGALAYNSSASVTLSDGQTVVGWDYMLRSGDADVASGSHVYVMWSQLQARWEVINASCPAP